MDAHFISQLNVIFSIFAYPKSNSYRFYESIDIVPVEDDEGDMLLTTEATREPKVINDVML